MRCIKILCAVFAGFLASPALAADKSDGCGVGWYVTQRTSLSATSTRSTTNYFLPPTFSMTSGTSNCTSHSLVNNDKKSLHFVEANFDQLRVDIAQGGGEYLGAFAATFGCDWPSYISFLNLMQENYSEVFGQSHISAQDITMKVRGLIHSSPNLANECHTA